MSQSGLQAPSHLRCEYHVNPLGLEEHQPRLSWVINDDRRTARQSAYQVVVASSEAKLAAGTVDVWDSGIVKSAQSTHISYGGPAVAAMSRYVWKVRTWDGAGEASPWSEPAWWEMGLMDRAAWQGRWIGAEQVGTPRISAPCPYLRKGFSVGKPIASARLYVTALGLYECYLNGQRIGNDVFTPGWTDYSKRVQYQTYDVTSQLRSGQNVLGAILGDGWYCGHLCWMGRQVHGDRPRLLAQLVVTFADGSRETVVTDESWKTSTGPLMAGDMLMGEHYDARLGIAGWAEAGLDDSAWKPVRLFEDPGIAIGASASPPVRRTVEIRPISHVNPGKTWPGKHLIYDLGQNMVGWVRLKIRGTRGMTVRLRHAELLNPDGTLYTANLRAAKATDYYTLKGDGEEIYEPRFTFHGFRYVEVEAMGLPDLELDAITGIVVHSDTPPTGEFSCSDPLVTQLQHNIQWGQRGNFIEAPTDCPQRDERLGWTGDAQVFVRTACFNMDVAGFFTKWAQDLRDSQGPTGSFPMVAPNYGYAGVDGGPAWAEAGIICPWTIYQCFGDVRILERHYPAMVRFIEQQQATSRDLIRAYDGYDGQMGFGDWLSTDTPPDGPAPTPKSLIGTAYFARSVQLMAKIADLLQKPDAAAQYRQLWQGIKKAFNQEFVTPRGMVGACTQTGYLLALAFDLIDDDKQAAVSQRLISAIRDRNWHLSTGFVGTPLLAPTLTRLGRGDVAYRILLQQTFPGWLYSITQGATTIWERWNGWTKEHGLGDTRPEFAMNSFNHYAYGAIGQWLYASVAGIDFDEAEPGYRHLIVRPEIGGGFTWAKGSLQSMYGQIATHWRIEGARLMLDVMVPANSHATVCLPTASAEGVCEGGQLLESAPGITQVRTENGRVVCEVGAGTYRFDMPAPPAGAAG